MKNALDNLGQCQPIKKRVLIDRQIDRQTDNEVNIRVPFFTFKVPTEL